MAAEVNKEKQSNLDNFVTQTPKSSNKRDHPASSPDNDSPSMLQVEKQARITSIDSSSQNEDIEQTLSSSVQKDTILQLSEVVCATLKNPVFIDSIIPQISKKVIDMLKPQIRELVDECLQPHLEEMKYNKESLIIQQVQLNNQSDEIKSLSNMVKALESRIEEQEQYSRRTSLRFNNVRVPIDSRGNVVTQIDTDSIILDICQNKLGVKLSLNDIGRSHPIGDIRDGKAAIIVRFLTYRQRQMVFTNKRKLKGDSDKLFIAENLTKYRYDLLKQLNSLRKNKSLHSYWTHDGTLIAKAAEKSRPIVVKSRQDILHLSGEEI